MVVLLVLCASLPAMLCMASSALLALRDRRQWIWFAALSIFASIGDFLVVDMMRVWAYAH
jgi:hypothetical protein